ncbi:MAG: tetratricopeptide repeat protein, partial [Vulcanimicrobiota bacterium]
NIVKGSGYFDYHETYFDPAKALEEYRENLGKANPNQIITEEDGVKKVFHYEPSDGIKENLTRINTLIEEGKFDEAEVLVNKSIELDPEYSSLHVYLGRIHHRKGEVEKALSSYEQALSVNPVDILALNYKAEALMEKDGLIKDRDSLVRALVLQRNYELTWQNLKKLGKEMGFEVYDEPFLPLYSLQRMDNKKIRIYIDLDTVTRWMPYSFCKAVWQYYPGYFEKKMGEKEYRETLQEEYECVENMLWSYNAFRVRGKYPRDPMLERMKDIKTRFFIKEFIKFEIMAPEHPELLTLMDQKHILDMEDYIKEYILVEKE